MNIDFSGTQISLQPTKIVCTCRNYMEHAREMNEPKPDEPIFFIKPPTTIVPDGSVIELPSFSNRVEHEIELAVVMKDKCKNISAEDAIQHVLGFTILLDMTARDMQNEAKKRGLPWTKAKCFDNSAPLGPKIVPPDKIKWNDLEIRLSVNGKVKQDGRTADMIFSVEELISSASKLFTLYPMDVIATGTPSGVGPVFPGDVIEGYIEGIGALTVKCGKSP